MYSLLCTDPVAAAETALTTTTTAALVAKRNPDNLSWSHEHPAGFAEPQADRDLPKTTPPWEVAR